MGRSRPLKAFEGLPFEGFKERHTTVYALTQHVLQMAAS